MEQIESIRGRAKTARRLQAVTLSNMINRIEASTMSQHAGAMENSSKGNRFIRRLTEALGNKSVEDEIYTGDDDTTRIYVYIASDNEIVKEVGWFTIAVKSSAPSLSVSVRFFVFLFQLSYSCRRLLRICRTTRTSQ